MFLRSVRASFSNDKRVRCQQILYISEGRINVFYVVLNDVFFIIDLLYQQTNLPVNKPSIQLPNQNLQWKNKVFTYHFAGVLDNPTLQGRNATYFMLPQAPV